MPHFQYEARTLTGEIRKGEMDAPNQSVVIDKLKGMRMRPPIKVVEVSKKKKGLKDIQITIPGLPFGKKVKEKDLVVFTRQFATMIDSGLPLVSCLEILSKQTTNLYFRKQLQDIKATVEGGATFADSLKKFPDTFDPLYVNLISAGEIGGILDTILNRLANYIEKNMKLKKKVKGAMVYPATVLTVAVAVMTLLLVKVIPVFEKMFKEFERELPSLTQMTINLSKTVQKYFPFFIMGIIGIVILYRIVRKTDSGGKLLDKIYLKLPIFGELIKKIGVSRFCRTLGTMISSGVAILDALEICSKTAGNKIIEAAIMNAREAISEGKSIADPLSDSNVFPPMVTQMISVGESTGALDTMLNKISDFYDEEVDAAISGLTALLEPLLMIFMGIGAGGLLISMYLPIFTMASAVVGG